MNRLTNQYGAFNTPLGKCALDLVLDFESKVQNFIKSNNLSPEEIRILSSITNADVTCAEQILTKALAMKKSKL